MTTTLLVVGVLVLGVHVLIHLLEMSTVLRRAAPSASPRDGTAVLAGGWTLGPRGARIYGVMWGVAAGGFTVAAVGMMSGMGWWRPVLLVSTLLSLGLTATDWRRAFVGLIINVFILGALVLGPRVAEALAA